jgi:hypothetical protein
MATTTYKNHLVEITVVSGVPMSLFEDALGQELVRKLLKLNFVSGVEEMKAEQVGTVVEFTIIHNGGKTYYDEALIPDGDLTWPNAVNDPFPQEAFVFLMETRLSLRKIFQAFQPTLVEVIWL